MPRGRWPPRRIPPTEDLPRGDPPAEKRGLDGQLASLDRLQCGGGAAALCRPEAFTSRRARAFAGRSRPGKLRVDYPFARFRGVDLLRVRAWPRPRVFYRLRG